LIAIGISAGLPATGPARRATRAGDRVEGSEGGENSSWLTAGMLNVSRMCRFVVVLGLAAALARSPEQRLLRWLQPWCRDAARIERPGRRHSDRHADGRVPRWLLGDRTSRAYP